MKLILLTVVFLQALFGQCAITDFWDNQNIDKSTLLCLKKHNYLEEVFALATLDSSQNQWTTNTKLSEIAEMGTVPQVVLSTMDLQGELPPELEAYRIFTQFKDSPVLKYWINLSSFRTPFRPSCGYLRKLSLFLELYSGLKVGIQTEPLFWQDLFGDLSACPELARHDLFLSFSDFTTFGGWEQFRYYETYQSVEVCGYPGMVVFKP